MRRNHEDTFTRKLERDLALAGEFGRELLQTNDELRSAIERHRQESARRIEGLEQERHSRRRQLEDLEDSWQVRVSELQSEERRLRESLDAATSRAQERSLLVTDLGDQNQRLGKQLAEAEEAALDLRAQVRHLREQAEAERASVREQGAYLEALRGELVQAREQRRQVEAVVVRLEGERAELVDSLEMAVGKVFSLERRAKEQEREAKLGERELGELRSSNQYLLERLEQWSLSLRSSPVSARASLLSELELSVTDSLCRGSVFDKIEEEEEEEDEVEGDAESFKTDIEVDDRTYSVDNDSSLNEGLRSRVEASCHELTRLSSLLRQHHSRKRKRLDPNLEESSGPEKKRLDQDLEDSGPEKKKSWSKS